VRATADDPIGLAGVELHYRVNGGPEQGPFPLTEVRDAWQTVFPPLAVVPGDEITYRLVAEDASSRANRSEAGPYTFVMVAERERVLLIDDRSNLKSLESDGLVNPHGSGSTTITGDKSANDFQTMLTALGYRVDVIPADEVTDGATNGYDVVVVNSAGNWYPVFHEPLRAELIHYVEQGGRILSEGGETAFMAIQFDREYCGKVLNIKEYFGEGGYTLFHTHGVEDQPFSNRPHTLPHTIEIEAFEGYYNASDIVEAADDATVHYNSYFSVVTGGVVTGDDNTGLDGGQSVFIPFNFDYLKPAMAEWLLENAMTWLTIREADGPSAVTGRVLLADAQDHAGTLVEVDEYHQAVTAADGSFTITGLWGGSHTLTATREGYGDRSLVVPVAEGQTVGIADLVLSPMVLVEGSSDMVITIPDNNPAGIDGEIAIAGSGAIQAVTVFADISHYSINNLVVKLISPAGTEVTLHNRSGGTADDLAGTWPTDLTVDGPGDLTDFFDEEVRGTWRLNVSDNQFGATGRLNRWSLVIQVSPDAPAGVERTDPGTTRIIGNAPNPFNPRTVIAFELAKSGRVRLDVYDIRGRRVRSLVDGEMGPGVHRILWDGLDERGGAASSGLYFSKLRAGGRTEVGKMLLVR
jgi:subtilisin-like proprotein convertase family protein